MENKLNINIFNKILKQGGWFRNLNFTTNKLTYIKIKSNDIDFINGCINISYDKFTNRETDNYNILKFYFKDYEKTWSLLKEDIGE